MLIWALASTKGAQIGPTVYDGAPFSAIGEVELRFHGKFLIGGPIALDPKPLSLATCDYCQFGAGNHSSLCRKIVGSVDLHLLTDCNSRV